MQEGFAHYLNTVHSVWTYYWSLLIDMLHFEFSLISSSTFLHLDKVKLLFCESSMRKRATCCGQTADNLNLKTCVSCDALFFLTFLSPKQFLHSRKGKLLYVFGYLFMSYTFFSICCDHSSKSYSKSLRRVLFTISLLLSIWRLVKKSPLQVWFAVFNVFWYCLWSKEPLIYTWWLFTLHTLFSLYPVLCTWKGLILPVVGYWTRGCGWLWCCHREGHALLLSEWVMQQPLPRKAKKMFQVDVWKCSLGFVWSVGGWWWRWWLVTFAFWNIWQVLCVEQDQCECYIKEIWDTVSFISPCSLIRLTTDTLDDCIFSTCNMIKPLLQSFLMRSP